MRDKGEGNLLLDRATLTDEIFASSYVPRPRGNRESHVRLGSLLAQGVLVITSPAAWNRMVAGVDEFGPAAELWDEDAFVISRETSWEVVEQVSTRSKIRVLDGPYTGRTGWVIPEIAAPAFRAEAVAQRG